MKKSLKEYKSQPDATVQESRGKLWARVRALECPWCRAVFYGYQLVGGSVLLPEGTQHDVFRFGEGARDTCGDALCWESEQSHQNRKRQREWLAKQAEEEGTSETKKRRF